MAKNTEKNRLPANVKARKEYEKRNYKRQTVLFKNAEMEEIESYCKKNETPKNTLLRKATMTFIGKSFE